MPSEQRDRVPRYGPGMVRVWSGERLARRRSEMQFMTMFAVRMRLGQSRSGPAWRLVSKVCACRRPQSPRAPRCARPPAPRSYRVCHRSTIRVAHRRGRSSCGPPRISHIGYRKNATYSNYRKNEASALRCNIATRAASLRYASLL